MTPDATALTAETVKKLRDGHEKVLVAYGKYQAPHSHALIIALCDFWLASAQPGGVTEAYDAGWIECTKWAKRDDLICDMDSPAYKRDRDRALEAAAREGK